MLASAFIPISCESLGMALNKLSMVRIIRVYYVYTSLYVCSKEEEEERFHSLEATHLYLQ